jgi:uncharacterized tellurite resistance protein B-like protein
MPLTPNEQLLLKETTRLSVNVTALTAVVEMLLVQSLLKADDPRAAAGAMVDEVFKNDQDALKHGASDFSLLISEALTSLIDRATQTAIRRLEDEGPAG